MSVILFGAQELANIGRVLLARETARDQEMMCDFYARDLAKISEANAACYRYRYSQNSENGPSISAPEFNALLREDKAGNLASAVSTASLLHYNCREDRDFIEETKGASTALANILEGLLQIVAEKAGLLR